MNSEPVLRESLRCCFPSEGAAAIEARFEAAAKSCRDEGIEILERSQFPPLLSETPDPPPALFVRGDPAALTRGLLLAFVGTRRPSAYGLRAGTCFASELVARGVTLVSGLARGLDGVGHSAAVAAKQPTVAVLGHGLDRVYPSEHRALARQILDTGGCLVSEYPPGVVPQPMHFPRRNRILSGLSYGVLVIEAGLKSGTRITARHALEQNRQVFVVPGPYFEAGFAGSHWLLQQGARLVTNAEDIVEDLAPGLLPAVEPAAPDGGAERLLREWIRTQGVAHWEEILGALQVPPNEIRKAMETARENGWIVESGAQRFVYAGK